MRRREKSARARAAQLAPERARGPFAYLVGAFDGLSAARPLRESVDAALASPVLGRRAKALIFAVVARGLDDALSARESSDLLGECGLSGELAESVLTHLGSAELEPIENALAMRPASLALRPHCGMRCRAMTAGTTTCGSRFPT